MYGQSTVTEKNGCCRRGGSPADMEGATIEGMKRISLLHKRPGQVFGPWVDPSSPYKTLSGIHRWCKSQAKELSLVSCGTSRRDLTPGITPIAETDILTVARACFVSAQNEFFFLESNPSK